MSVLICCCGLPRRVIHSPPPPPSSPLLRQTPPPPPEHCASFWRTAPPADQVSVPPPMSKAAVCGRNGVRNNESSCWGFFPQVCDSFGLSGNRPNPRKTTTPLRKQATLSQSTTAKKSQSLQESEHLSERDGTLQCSVHNGAGAMVPIVPWPVPGHQRLDIPSESAGCLATRKKKRKNHGGKYVERRLHIKLKSACCIEKCVTGCRGESLISLPHF